MPTAAAVKRSWTAQQTLPPVNTNDAHFKAFKLAELNFALQSKAKPNSTVPHQLSTVYTCNNTGINTWFSVFAICIHELPSNQKSRPRTVQTSKTHTHFIVFEIQRLFAEQCNLLAGFGIFLSSILSCTLTALMIRIS